ncbi:MAG: alpha/beta hydrolase [Spirochaetaceae bacterium]
MTALHRRLDADAGPGRMREPRRRVQYRYRYRYRYRAGLIAGIALGVFLLSGCQDLFVYHPATDDEETLLVRAREKGLEPWPQAGEGRMGWYAPAPVEGDVGGDGAGDHDAGADKGGDKDGDTDAGAAPASRESAEPHRVIVFHGNGGQSVARGHFVRGFQSDGARGRWEVYLLEYPGFGSRPGDPSEEALVSAAEEAVTYLLKADPDRPVYVVGESLGTGVASQVAAAYPDDVPAVLLITPFTDIVDVGAKSAPRFLVRAILRDRYDSVEALSRYDGRVGVLLAGQDDVVPTDLGRRLYEGYEGPKHLWIQEEAGHNDLDYDPESPFWAEVTEFLLGPLPG